MSYLPRLPRAVRHTLSPDPKISMSSLPFPHPLAGSRFFVESGCKDTTIFQSDKHFFPFFRKIFPSVLCVSVLQTKIFFLCGGNGDAKRGFRGCSPPFFGGRKAGFFGFFAHNTVNQPIHAFTGFQGAAGDSPARQGTARRRQGSAGDSLLRPASEGGRASVGGVSVVRL